MRQCQRVKESLHIETTIFNSDGTINSAADLAPKIDPVAAADEGWLQGFWRNVGVAPPLDLPYSLLPHDLHTF